MRLNHLDIHVLQPTATAAFLTAHLGLRETHRADNGHLVILTDGAGFELVLSTPVEAFGATSQASLEWHTGHIGFILADRAEVDATHARMRAAGVTSLGEPRALRGGWLFYCVAPGHLQIEVGARDLLV